MAYTNVQSGEISEGTQYYSGKLPLGDYTFYMQIDNSSGSPKVVTRCDSPDGIRAATQRTLPEGSHVTQWSIEVNESEASVYAAAVSDAIPFVPSADAAQVKFVGSQHYLDTLSFAAGSGQITIYVSGNSYVALAASDDSGARASWAITPGGIDLNMSYEIYGKTVYYGTYSNSSSTGIEIAEPRAASIDPIDKTAWGMIYGARDSISESFLVARFAIGLGDAGGYPGGNGDWISPGDWNSDPTTTLHLTVNGALSGRHNDPIVDPSFSYLPTENTAQAGYGCGGDGGNGGGGGAGASTVIVRQFATNKANYKDIVALAKRHGYGSGGGKGGQGGDGCILIYY